MRKLIFLMVFIFITNKNFSLELVNEVRLELPKKYGFSKIYSADYNSEKNILLLIESLSNILSVNQGKNVFGTDYTGAFVFSNSGKFLGEVGKFNSYDKDGIVSIAYGGFYDNKINIRDSSKDELMIFNIEKPFKYNFSIKTIYKPITCVASILKNNKIISLTTSDNKYIRKGKITLIDIDKFKRAAIIDLISESKSKKNSKIMNIKRIFSYKKQFYNFWYDKKILKNKFIKKRIKIWKKRDKMNKNFALFFLYVRYNIGPSFLRNIITFGKQNFFLSNSYGTEIVEYNFNGDSLFTYPIKKYKKLKDKEIVYYKELLFKKVKNYKQAKKFSNIHSISELRKLIYDKIKNNIILVYDLKNDFLQFSNLPKAKTYLLVYSLDKRKAVSDFIPIDFIPVNLDSDKRELIGVQQRDNDIYLQFYKWEY